MEIGLREARASLPELIERLERGEEVWFTRRGKRVARLMKASDVKAPYALPEKVYTSWSQGVHDAQKTRDKLLNAMRTRSPR